MRLAREKAAMFIKIEIDEAGKKNSYIPKDLLF